MNVIKKPEGDIADSEHLEDHYFNHGESNRRETEPSSRDWDYVEIYLSYGF